MRKKYIILYVTVLITFLVGCSERANNNLSMDNTTITEYNTTDSVEDDSGSFFSFSSVLNVFYNESNIPLENKISVDEDKLISLSLLSNVTPDKSLAQSNIPVRIWVIADETPIEFSLFGSENYAVSNDVIVDAMKDQWVDISFMASKNMKMITIFYLYFPEDIPEQGKGTYGGGITYSIVNTEYAGNKNNSDNSLGYYIEVPQIEDNYGIDIGKESVENNNNKVCEEHFYEDVSLYDDDSLYVKFNSGDKKQISYHIFVLRDGIMIDFFEESLSCTVNCSSGKRTFQYPISNKYIPDSGLHTFQVLAIPAEEVKNFAPYSTNKIRVQSIDGG